MPTLFDPIRIGNIKLNNRIIMAPMTRSRANDDGIQPPFAAEYYGQRSPEKVKGQALCHNSGRDFSD